MCWNLLIMPWHMKVLHIYSIFAITSPGCYVFHSLNYFIDPCICFLQWLQSQHGFIIFNSKLQQGQQWGNQITTWSHTERQQKSLCGTSTEILLSQTMCCIEFWQALLHWTISRSENFITSGKYNYGWSKQFYGKIKVGFLQNMLPTNLLIWKSLKSD